MLGVTGAWAQENLVGVPWFMAGKECTFETCQLSYLNNGFTESPTGALFGLIFFEIVLMGGAEGFRTGGARHTAHRTPHTAHRTPHTARTHRSPRHRRPTTCPRHVM